MEVYSIVLNLGFAVSVILFLFGKHRYAIALLFLCSIYTFSNAALLDDFVSMWDERFHALVAKNLMKHPLVPTLYDDPVLNMVYAPWDRYHIWLHKPPLFLWQIALSFKLFGLIEFTLRLPSIIMASLLVLIVYRSGKLLVNRQVGFYAAMLVASSYYLTEMVAGRKMLEHNDVAFIFYISASIWAWTEYLFSKKENSHKWVLLAGLFSGFAILTKWLPGLLVYLGWAIYILLNKKNYKSDWFSKLKEILLAFTITLIIALPWQLYTWIRFPIEKAMESKTYSDHFNVSLDGHGGDFFYHIQRIGELYSWMALYLFIPALIAFYYFGKNKKLNLSTLSMVVFVYLFYSVAKTKMPAFTFILILPVVISFGSLMQVVTNFISRNISKPVFSKLIIIVFVGAICWFNLNTIGLYKNHDPKGDAAVMLVHNKNIFKGLKEKLPADAVVFNVKGRHFIECMFYSDFTAYGIIPTQSQITEIKNKGRKIAVFDTDNLPDYFYNNPDIILIQDQLKGWN